jgi:glutathione S-transferase
MDVMADAKIKLIGTPASRVMRNIWMLAELGLAYEHDPITTADTRLKQPPYTDWNPNGKIPILIVDGFAIYESLAINFYLDLRFPSALSLHNAEDRALALQWAMWVLTEVEAHSFNWYLNSIGKPMEERDAAVAREAWQKLQAPLAVLEKRWRRGRTCWGRISRWPILMWPPSCIARCGCRWKVFRARTTGLSAAGAATAGARRVGRVKVDRTRG